jgi:hypothetical protein
MTTTEPAPPANAAHVWEWERHDDTTPQFRAYLVEYGHGVRVIGLQRFDGSISYRSVYADAAKDLDAEGTRARALALLFAADELDT